MNDNIVIICFKYPPEYSGYGKQLKSVLENIDSNIKKTITLLTAFTSSKKEENDLNQIVVLGSRIFTKEKYIFYIFCLKVLIWLFFNNKKYSIIHCIKAGPEAIMANLVSKLFKKKLVVKVAQDELSDREIKNVKGFKKFTRRMRQLILSTVDYYIAISQDISNELHRKVSKSTKIIEIPNGVDTTKFSPVSEVDKLKVRKKLKIATEESPIVLYAGAINKRKGVHDLIDAIERIEREVRFSIIFCGPMLENIKFEESINRINKTNPNINIYYHGVVNNIDEYMKAADIFVLPSYSEGLPNVLLEAGASGLALIATDIGGNRDVIQNGKNGFLVPVNKPEYLAKKLTELISNKKLRDLCGHEAREFTMNNYSIYKISKIYEDLYLKLLRN